MRRGPRWSQSEGGPLAHAVGAKAKEAPSPMRWGPKPRRPPRPCGGGQSQGGPRAHAAGASLVPKRRRSLRPCGGGLGGPKVEEAPSPVRRGPRWSQSGRDPLAHAAGALKMMSLKIRNNLEPLSMVPGSIKKKSCPLKGCHRAPMQDRSSQWLCRWHGNRHELSPVTMACKALQPQCHLVSGADVGNPWARRFVPGTSLSCGALGHRLHCQASEGPGWGPWGGRGFAGVLIWS